MAKEEKRPAPEVPAVKVDHRTRATSYTIRDGKIVAKDGAELEASAASRLMRQIEKTRSRLGRARGASKPQEG